MIPTPAKRLSQRPPESLLPLSSATGHDENENDDSDNGDEGRLYSYGRDNEHVDLCEAVEGENEDVLEDEEDYMRLDTIVEEEEEENVDESETTANHENSRRRPLALLRHQQQQRCDETIGESPAEKSEQRGRPTQSSLESSRGGQSNDNNNPLNTSNNNSLRKFTPESSTNQEQQQAVLMNKKKMQQQQQQQQQDANKAPLPSTNRLISEHQVRQQQALFRALAERQKLMDELDPSERVDLMSSAAAVSLSRVSRLALRRRRKQERRRRERRSQETHSSRANDYTSDDHNADEDPNRHGDLNSGVPLSAVDLTSISDRMLDELLGHIASASPSESSESSGSSSSSSSSLSSNGESLDSSDFSAGETASSASNFSDTDDGATQPSSRRSNGHRSTTTTTGPGSLSGRSRSTSGRHTRVHSARRNNSDTPNVIGVHEDERTRGGAGGTRINCRDAHRRSRTNGHDSNSDSDDDTDKADHELIVQLNNNNNETNHNSHNHLSDSMSSPGSAVQQQRLDSSIGSHSYPMGAANGPAAAAAAAPNKLEEYFTSGLVNPHNFAAAGHPLPANTIDDQFCDTTTNSSTASKIQADCVEEVLAQMLGALQEIGTENQEQLNELLERGFAHLEQLLNCSLNPAQSNSPQRSQPQPSPSTRKTTVSPGANLPQMTQLVSKDSDYGSDTQSADCFSHLAAGSQGELNVVGPPPSSATQVNSNSHSNSSAGDGSGSPSPISLGPASQSSSSMSTKKQATANDPDGAGSNLSPLAIELSFKLAESLHRLAQQQQLRQQQQQQQQQQRQPQNMTQNDGDEMKRDPGSKPSGGRKKSPMKSIVMINSSSPSVMSSSSASCSPELALMSSTSTSSSSAEQQRPQSKQLNAESRAARNLTPASDHHGGADDQPNQAATAAAATVAVVEQSADQQSPTPSSCGKKPQFRTCLDISSGGQVRVVVSASSSPANNNAAQQKQQQQQPPAADQQVDAALLDQPNVQVISQPKLKHQQEFVRRRSGRSSLRRRPSFSGSSTGVRPGSPVPRSSIGGGGGGIHSSDAPSIFAAPESSQQDLKTTMAATEQDQHEKDQQLMSKQKQGKQLQRVLIMAQKYNYSPAKLAASKLSSRLQLKDFANDNNNSSQPSDSERISSSFPPAPTEFQPTSIDGTTTATIDSPKAALQLQQDQKRMLAPGSGEIVRITGQVQLDISYFAKSGSLTVHVMQCSQLAPLGKRRNTSNPYVKLYLLPDRSRTGKRKSAVHKSQLNPKFDEKFTFGPIQLVDFDARILWLSVWHRLDRSLGRNEFLGEILLPLSQVRHQLLHSDLCQSTSPKWYQLQDKQQLNASPAGSKQANQLDGRQLAAHPRRTAPSSQQPPNVNKQQQQLQHQHRSSSANLNGTQHLRNSIGGRQVELADKLGELQRKAALLTTAVAPSSGLKSQQRTMNVLLGPMVDHPLAASHITGKLFVALKFVPQGDGDDESVSNKRSSSAASGVGELHVNIKEAHNIAGFENPSVAAVMAAASHESAATLERSVGGEPRTATRVLPSGALPNPFCKCYLLASNGQRVAKHKTAHLKRTSNPRWDFKCVFGQVSLAGLSSQAIEILMFNRDSILVSNNVFLGGIRLCCSSAADNSTTTTTTTTDHRHQHQRPNSMDANGSISSSEKLSGSSSSSYEDSLCSERESRLWNQMLARPNIWVYGELELRLLRPLVAQPINNHSHSAAETNAGLMTTSGQLPATSNYLTDLLITSYHSATPLPTGDGRRN